MQTRSRTRTATLLVVGLAVLAVAGIIALNVAPSSDNNSKPSAAAAVHTDRVTLDELSIGQDADRVSAGKVTFVARNAGAEKHEFVVIRTNKPAANLLKGKEASEAGAVDEIEDVAPGATERLTLNLKPGHYALICNLPGHYVGGMRTDLTVVKS